jgi:hypothetical protein
MKFNYVILRPVSSISPDYIPFHAFLSENQESVDNMIERGELLENDIVILIDHKYKVVKRSPLKLQEDKE